MSRGRYIPDFPAKMLPYQKCHFSTPLLQHWNQHNMRNIDRIPEEITDLESQEVPNVKATAEKYDVARKTLENR